LQVLEAYKLGVAALKSTLKESGLTEDSAADTMVQVEEVSCYNKTFVFVRLRRMSAVSSEHAWMEADCG
jgi:hypothetical protein